jgi:hypothetical protein
MPEVILNCPQCQHPLRVTEELQGRPVKCPACGLTFTVPAGSSEAQPLPVAPGSTREPESARQPPGEEEELGGEYYEESPRRPRRPSRWDYEHDDSDRARARVLAPAICLLVAGCLGLLFDLAQVGLALVREPPAPVRQGPPANFLEGFKRGLEESRSGPVPIILGSIFASLSMVIILAAIQMLRGRMYGFAFAGSILAMVNLGNFCCLLGLPFGIWSLVVLSKPEVKSFFEQRARPDQNLQF